MLFELCVSFIFPHYGPNSWCPPFLPRLPWVAVFPVRRYYAGTLNRCFPFRFLSSSVVSDTIALSRFRSICRLPGRQCRLSFCLLKPVFLRSSGGAALPTFRGDPMHACHGSRTPVDLEMLAVSHPFVLPSAGIKTSAPRYVIFEAQSRACVACCLRFTVRLPFLRKTRYRLLARLCRVGLISH